jgi:hypothetical protein
MNTYRVGFQSKEKHRIFEVTFVYFISLLILSVRNPYLAYDAQVYIDILQYEIPYSGEWGFFLYNKLVHNILNFNNGNYLILTSGVILTIYFISFYRLGIRDIRMLFLLASPAVILLSINGIRQGFGLAILTLIFSFNSKWVWMGLVVIASGFHKGALVIGLFGLIAMVFKKYYTYDKLLFIILPIISFILSYIALPLLMHLGKVEAFSNMNFNNGSTFYIRLIVYLMLYSFVVYRIYNIRSVRYISDYFMASTIGLVLLFQNVPYFSSRLAYFLEIFLLISLLLRVPAYSVFNRIFYFLSAIIFMLLIYSFPSVKVQMF